MKTYRLKKYEIQALQFTDDDVKALCFDDVPLPPHVHVSGRSWHREQRRLDYYSAYVEGHCGDRRPIKHGEWVIEQDGEIWTMDAETFHATYQELPQ